MRQLNSALQKAVEGIARLDRDGRYVYVSQAYAEMAGFTPDEVLGKKWDALVHPDDHVHVNEMCARMAAEGQAAGEIRGLRKDGSVYYRDVLLVPVRDEEGQDDGLYSLTNDITERKQAEGDLKALTEGLRAVVAAADELIACPDLDTLYRRAVELAREKIGIERCALFLDEEETVRGTYGTSLQRQTTQEHNHVINKSDNWEHRFQPMPPEEPKWFISDETYLEWDGSKPVPCGRGWVVLTPIPSSNSDARLIGVFTNDRAITGGPPDDHQQEILAVFCSLLGNIIQRKRAEEDRARSLEREREKSEQLQLAIREAHHRIKNNLQAVSDLLHLELHSAKRSTSRHVLQASLERIQAIALVHNLLTVDETDEDVRWVDMKGIVDRLIPKVLTGYGYSTENVRLKLEVPPVQICTKQATSLALILNELTSNAAKHAFTGERPAELKVCLEATKEGYELHVQDNGSGLPPQFDLQRDSHVGLEVARMLAKNDLKGNLELIPQTNGVLGVVRFPAPPTNRSLSH